MVHQDPKFRLSYRLRGLASPRRYRRQKSLQGVFCIIVMVANSYCSGASADIRRSGPTSSPNLLLSAAVPEACAAWREKVSRIHPSQRNVFSKHGVVLAGGGILLAAKFEQNCKLRLRLGEYFGRRVGGEATEYDQEFAKDHSKRVVAVLGVRPSISLARFWCWVEFPAGDLLVRQRQGSGGRSRAGWTNTAWQQFLAPRRSLRELFEPHFLLAIHGRGCASSICCASGKSTPIRRAPSPTRARETLASRAPV